jgi:DNA-binding beta-propeller fold protein YncE
VSPLSLHQLKPETALQWPPKPNEARIQWVKTIADPLDAGISKGFWKKALEFFTGADQRRIVRPYGILFDESERLFIADPGAGVVHFMDMKEQRYTIIGEESTIPLRSPIGIAEDEKGQLYITDSEAGMVYRYDLARRVLEPFIAGYLQRPTGIAYSRFNKLLYIVDTTANQVVAVDDRGAERLRISTKYNGDGQFNRPTDIFIDAKGQVYVTDSLNYLIRVFTADGKPVSQFGAAGDNPGNLDKPKGVAVDSEGHIYVNDALLDAVQIFDGKGQFLLSFGSAGTRNGEFWMPSGIWIDRKDYIFIADTYNQRVQVFRYFPATGPNQGAARKPVQN